MQRLIRQLRQHPDRGASAVLVALVMLVLIGFTGLGVDVTSAYAKSQEVQNAADAAALATAQHCAQLEVGCAPGSQSDPATDLAQQNVRAQVDTVAAFDTYPASNRATVKVTAEHQNFFAGAFGFNSFTVVREATAQWEAPQAGPAMLPLTVSACNFYDSAGQPVLHEGIEVWLPKGKLLQDKKVGCGTLKYPPGGFGWLDHSGCQVTVVVGGWAGGDTGANRPDSCLVAALEIGEIFLLPIFDAFEGNGANAQYRIDRFAALQLQGYHFKEGGPNITDGTVCSGKPPSNSDYRDSCLNVTFVEWVNIADDYVGGGSTTDAAVVRLIDPSFEDKNS